MSDITTSKGRKVADDITALIRARNPLIWIVSREEARVEQFLVAAAQAVKYQTHFWDVAAGVTTLDGEPDPKFRDTADPADALKAIKASTKATGAAAQRGLWVMRDLPVWIQGTPGATPLRALRNLARFLPSAPRAAAQTIVVLSPSGDVPPELAGHATVVEWPLPDRTEIASVLDATINSLPEVDGDGKPLRAAACTPEIRDLAIDAAIGLTGEEAASCYSRSLVQTRKIDPLVVSNEKRRVISKEKVLEWFDPLPGGLDAVGGLDNLKTWLVDRKNAYSPAARAYGLPAPKGAGLVGISGCGKSLTAKAIATAWNVPLIRLDLGALKDKYVGGSEANIRKAFKIIETIDRCVVWIDEIEKALAGASGSAADGGVSADALGTVLSWMQERTGQAFVIFTANDIEALPPELTRKGRFDEIFFVDTPNHVERPLVIKAALRKFNRGELSIDLKRVADACQDFTSAECAEIVPTALYAAFADGEREPTTADLLAAAKDVSPLVKTSADKVAKLRQWANSNSVRRASSVPQDGPASSVRELDFEAA